MILSDQHKNERDKTRSSHFVQKVVKRKKLFLFISFSFTCGISLESDNDGKEVTREVNRRKSFLMIDGISQECGKNGHPPTPLFFDV